MEILNNINDVLWTYIVITILVGCAVYFTIRLKGMQFRSLGEMLRQTFGGGRSQEADDKGLEAGNATTDATGATPQEKHISPFQAFAVSLSSRVGTGNLAGVASAICVGGPGAVFWMWVMALMGSATAFVEATLAQLYKRRGADSFYGGPAYYILHGLHWRWMAVLFAVLITITFGMANQAVQSTTICDAVGDFLGVDKFIVGLFLTLASAIVVFGGVQRVSRFAAMVVPFMAFGYILLSFYVIVANITMVPQVIKLIIESAFGINQVAGGVVGVAIMQGVKRGLFSNEAGEGSAPNAAAIATTSHPVKQGYLQAFGVFVDTLIICTCTAAIILLAGNYAGGQDGILLTAEALEITVGKAGRYFLVAAIFLFAYSTIIANCFYGETNVRFMFSMNGGSERRSRIAVQSFRALSCGWVLFGSSVSLQTTWSIVDICMGLMTICNLVAIFLLFPKVLKLFRDFRAQRRSGHDPVFRRSSMPELADDLEAW